MKFSLIMSEGKIDMSCECYEIEMNSNFVINLLEWEDERDGEVPCHTGPCLHLGSI
jgi:hypothetical protein